MSGSSPQPSFREQVHQMLRESILDAAWGRAAKSEWDVVRIADIARDVGVSRQTIYNEFGSRQALVEAYISHEIENLIAEVERSVRANAHDPGAALQAAFGLFLRLASDEPVIQMITSDAGEDQLVPLLTKLGRAIADERITRLIVDVWPRVDASDAELVAESLVRLAISHALSPTSDPGTAARNVTRLVRPLFTEILGAS